MKFWPVLGSEHAKRAVLLGMVVAIAVGLHHTEWGKLLNGKLLDAAFVALRNVAPRAVERDVTVVGIDVDDLRKFSEPRDLWHANYGHMLAALASYRPAVVGLDIVLPERSYQHLLPGLDQKLMQGLLSARGKAPVVLARTVDDFSNFREIFAPYVVLAGPGSVGSVIVCRDDDDTIRAFDEFLCDPARREATPSLAGIMARHVGVEGTWRGLINYRLGDRFHYVPFREVVEGAGGGNEALRRALEGKPVLVGFMLPFEDRKTVPVDLAAWEPGNRSVPGVLVQAQILRSMLNGGLLQPGGFWPMALLCVAGAAFVLLPAGRRATAAFAGFVLVLTGAVLYLLTVGLYLEIAAPLVAAAAATTIRFVDDAMAEARERATLRNAFGGYVSPQIMSEILAGRITPELGGKRTRVCILFSDVRNFTTRSEHMAPEDLIAMLNDYFTEMTQCVHEHGGTVDKFIGDGMMCFFGAPQPLDNSCDAAVAAGKDMLARLEALNERFVARGKDPIAIGIGIHYGEVVLGHVGSDARHEYTAIGDAVNTASRIEGLTKGVGFALAVSADVFMQLSSKDEWEGLGQHKVKGRAAVTLYGYTASRTEANIDGDQTWIGMLGSRQ